MSEVCPTSLNWVTKILSLVTINGQNLQHKRMDNKNGDILRRTVYHRDDYAKGQEVANLNRNCT